MIRNTNTQNKLRLLIRQLVIESQLNEIDKDKKIKNPQTGRLVKLATVLSYGKGHPLYKKAQQLLQGDKKESGDTYSKSESSIDATASKLADKYNKLPEDQREGIRNKLETKSKEAEDNSDNFQIKTREEFDNSVDKHIENSDLSDDVKKTTSKMLDRYSQSNDHLKDPDYVKSKILAKIKQEHEYEGTEDEYPEVEKKLSKSLDKILNNPKMKEYDKKADDEYKKGQLYKTIQSRLK